MEYEEFLQQKLKDSPLIRHMFSRLNTEVIIATTTQKMQGMLRSIDISYRWFELEDHQADRTFFIKWDTIQYMESLSTDRILKKDSVF